MLQQHIEKLNALNIKPEKKQMVIDAIRANLNLSEGSGKAAVQTSIGHCLNILTTWSVKDLSSTGAITKWLQELTRIMMLTVGKPETVSKFLQQTKSSTGGLWEKKDPTSEKMMQGFEYGCPDGDCPGESTRQQQDAIMRAEMAELESNKNMPDNAPPDVVSSNYKPGGSELTHIAGADLDLDDEDDVPEPIDPLVYTANKAVTGAPAMSSADPTKLHNSVAIHHIPAKEKEENEYGDQIMAMESFLAVPGLFMTIEKMLEHCAEFNIEYEADEKDNAMKLAQKVWGYWKNVQREDANE